MKKESFLERLGLRRVKELIGFDIGTSSIKLCLLEKKKKGFALKRIAKKDYDRELLNDGVIVDELFLADELKKLLAIENVETKDAACAVSSYATIMKKVSIPYVEGEELENALKVEAEAQIPLPLGEIFYSYHVVGPDPEREGFLQVMIVAAKREIVEGYLAVFERAGLNLRILDVDIISVANIVEEIYRPQNNALIVDIGSSFTKIAILKGSDLQFTREIAIGGKYLTNQIERTFKIPYKEAEERKVNADQDVAYLFEDFIFNVTGEVGKTINFFKSIKTSENIESVYLTGGSCLLAGLKDKIIEQTGVQAEIINPFLILGHDYRRDKVLEEYTVFMPVALQLSSRVREFE